MWPFKKKKPPSVIEPPPCKHKWQDFPWIMRFYYDYNGRKLEVEIIEPYVCIYCKKRKNKVLIHDWYTEEDEKSIDRLMDEYREKYKDYTEPEAVIEDKISDFQMVDREWLEIVNALKQTRRAT